MNTTIMGLILEKALCRKGMNRLGLYQLRRNDEEIYRSYRHTPMYALSREGLTVRKENYQLVYVADLSRWDTLESIRRGLESPPRPDDFLGHTLSVGDIIVLNRGNRLTAHFVDKDEADAECFTELPDFLGRFRNQSQLSVLRSNIPYGKGKRENGYILSDGTVLLEEDLDTTLQYYTNGVGVDGKPTGFCYYPLEVDGKTIAFTEISQIEEDGTDD